MWMDRRLIVQKGSIWGTVKYSGVEIQGSHLQVQVASWSCVLIAKAFCEHSQLSTDLHSQGIPVFCLSRGGPLFLCPGYFAAHSDVSFPLETSPQTIKTKNHIEQEIQVATAATSKIDCFAVFTMFNPPARELFHKRGRSSPNNSILHCFSQFRRIWLYNRDPPINKYASVFAYLFLLFHSIWIHSSILCNLSFQMTKQIKAAPRKAKPKVNKPTAGRAKHSSWQEPETIQARVSRSPRHGRRVWIWWEPSNRTNFWNRGLPMRRRAQNKSTL